MPMKRIARGAEKIGAVIEEPNTSQVYYKLAKGYIPGAFKEGGTWCLSIPKYQRAVHGDAAPIPEDNGHIAQSVLVLNGTGPESCGDRIEAGIDAGVCQLGLFKAALPRTQGIRAELTGANTATANGITARSYTPVLTLCRQLLAAGLDPDQAMAVYRGATSCLHVRSIGEAAKLTVEDDERGTPRLRRHRLDRGAAPAVRKNGGRHG